MSKNITIKEDGSAQNFSGVGRLNVGTTEGGSADWVPEDEVQLGTIEISANGIYKASELGIYGFHTAIIKVPKENEVVGYGQDGNAYIVTRDEETGHLVRTQVPTKIEITTQPTKTQYTDGETIDYTGMVVTMKNKDESVFTDETYPTGVIPLSELHLPVQFADKNKTRLHVFWLSPYTNRVLRNGFRITVAEE